MPQYGRKEKKIFFLKKVGFLRCFSPEWAVTEEMKDNPDFGWMVMPLTRMQLQAEGRVYCRRELNNNERVLGLKKIGDFGAK